MFLFNHTILCNIMKHFRNGCVCGVLIDHILQGFSCFDWSLNLLLTGEVLINYLLLDDGRRFCSPGESFITCNKLGVILWGYCLHVSSLDRIYHFQVLLFWVLNLVFSGHIYISYSLVFSLLPICTIFLLEHWLSVFMVEPFLTKDFKPVFMVHSTKVGSECIVLGYFTTQNAKNILITHRGFFLEAL